jgi:DNA (cytosine-5)-methyltransferase 1
MQDSIFDLMYERYKITKPIRLIELFGGYGSQHFALEYLGANFEHWKLCEWAVKSIQAYKDAHYSNDTTDYSKDLTKQELIDYLFKKQISQDYNAPMDLKQISRQKEEWLRQVYNNIIITKNTVDITQTKSSDLEIVDTNKYTYIMTYSFPCQDLSLAGLGKGMARDSGTRSGMLWEVERILDECTELPQILLMENVPEVKGTNNVKYFNEWQSKLESLGYKNYHQNLIATDYGIPQTRNRTFMISILGNYSYTFPNAIPLKLKLKDMLEKEVDEKYYLSSKQLEQISNWNAYQNPFDTIDKENCPTLTTRSGAFAAGMVLTKDTENYIEWEDGKNIQMNCRAWKDDKIIATLNTGGATKIINKNLRIRKLTPKECFRLMGVKDDDYERIAQNQSDSSLYHLAGDSIVVNVLMAIFKELL